MQSLVGSHLRRSCGRAQGSSDEIALLAAEFALLDAPLMGLAAAVSRGEARLIGEDELVRLAADIPDLRARLGLQCARLWLRGRVRFQSSQGS